MGTHSASGLFWRYWTASTISCAGDAVTTVALPLTAVELLRASSFDVSLLTAGGYGAWILVGLPAGVIVGRLPLRGVQVAMDLARAAVLASVPLAAWAGVLTVGQLVVVAFVVGLAGVVFDVGNATFLPSIVPAEQLTARNSQISGSQAVTQLGGPSLGGVLVQALGAATSLVSDVISYLVSAVLLVGMPRPPTRTQSERDTNEAGDVRMTSQIRDGLRFVVGHSVIGPCVALATLVNFVCGALMAITPVFLVRTLGAPAWQVGILMATDGLGSLLGAAATPRLARTFGTARAMLMADIAGSVVALLMPMAGKGYGTLLFALGMTGFTAGVVVSSILTRTHRQTVTPPVLLPRVMATVRFISWGAIPFGALAAGAVAARYGNRTALWAICGVALLAPAVLVLSRVRGLRDLTDE